MEELKPNVLLVVQCLEKVRKRYATLATALRQHVEEKDETGSRTFVTNKT